MTRQEMIAALSLFLFAGLAVSADDTPAWGPDCEKRLEEFVPREVDTKTMALKAEISVATWPLLVTKAMRRQQLTEQYRTTPELREMFATPEEFIESVWPLFENEEEQTRSASPHRERIEILASATYMYAQYYDITNPHSPTQEVVKIKAGLNRWHTWRINHVERRIMEGVEKDANDFYGYYMALAPQDGHRNSWVTWYPLILKAEKQSETIGQLLCQSGQVTIANQTLSVRFIGTNRCAFTTTSPYHAGAQYTNAINVSEYVLERGQHVRLLRAVVRGPVRETEVTYDYRDDSSPWPSERHLVDKNVSNNQTLREEHMLIKEVAPSSKWNVASILAALLQKYAEYPNVIADKEEGMSSATSAPTQPRIERAATLATTAGRIGPEQQKRLDELRERVAASGQAADYAELAGYCWELFFDYNMDQVIPLALDSSQKALELDPTITNVVAGLTRYYLHMAEFTKAEVYARKLADIDLQRAEHVLSDAEQEMNEAVEESERQLSGAESDSQRGQLRSIRNICRQRMERIRALRKTIREETHHSGEAGSDLK